MSNVLSELRREHAHFARLLDALDWHVARLERGESTDYELLRQTLAYFDGFPDLIHHPKEDLIYTWLSRRAPQEIAAIGNLSREHEQLAQRSRDFAAAIDRVLGDAVVPRDALVRWARCFIELQRGHMQFEEKIFFPVAALKLTPADWADLEARFAARAADPAETAAATRFEALYDKITDWQAQAFSGSA